MGCPAEAPYNDEIIYCQLPANHLQARHVGIATPRCEECRRRDCHTDVCSGPDAHPWTERVEWAGPASPMPAPDFWTRLAMERFASARETADVIFELALGHDVLVASFLDDAWEWGSRLVRDA